MLQDAHSRKVSIPVEAPAGDTVVVASVPHTWLYVHSLTGDMDADGTFEVVAIAPDASERILANFDLDEGQGLNLSDEPGEDNRPRLEFFPGENFVLRTTIGIFTGACHYSLRY